MGDEGLERMPWILEIELEVAESFQQQAEEE